MQCGKVCVSLWWQCVSVTFAVGSLSWHPPRISLTPISGDGKVWSSGPSRRCWPCLNSTCSSLSQLRTTRTECVHQEVAQHQVALSVFWWCMSGVPGRLRGDQLFAAFFSRILGSPGVRLAVEAIWQACASSGLPLPSGEGWALLGPCRDPPPFQPLCSGNVVLRVQPSLGLSPECGSQPLCLGCRFWVRLSGSLRAMGGGLLCCGPWVLLYWLRPGLCLANWCLPPLRVGICIFRRRNSL